jgi:hypothetical protein
VIITSSLGIESVKMCSPFNAGKSSLRRGRRCAGDEILDALIIFFTPIDGVKRDLLFFLPLYVSI